MGATAGARSEGETRRPLLPPRSRVLFFEEPIEQQLLLVLFLFVEVQLQFALLLYALYQVLPDELY